MKEVTVNVKLNKQVYEDFSKYARENGFTAKALAQKLMLRAIEKDIAREMIQEFLNTKTN